MGVKGLWRLLLPIGRRISIETLEGKILAIDASIWLTQFLQALKDPNTGSTLPAAHLVGFLRRLCKLRFHGIRPVLVFDGATPEIKLRELKERRQRREQFAGRGKGGEDGGIVRMAKKLLTQQLQKHGRSLVKVAAEEAKAKQEGKKATDENEEKGSSQKASSSAKSSSLAPGFYDPNMENENDEGGKETSNSTADSEVAKQPQSSESDDRDILEILNDEEEATRKAREEELGEETNDWDKAVVTQSESQKEQERKQKQHDEQQEKQGDTQPKWNYGRRTKKKGSASSYAAFRMLDPKGEKFNVDHVASLPSHERKDWVEEAQKNRRMESRREFMKVAYDQEKFSNSQLQNFLKSSKLNQKIHSMATKAAKQESSEGVRQAGDRTKRIIFEREVESKQQAQKRSKAALLAEFSKKKLSILEDDKKKSSSDNDSDDEIEWEDADQKPAAAATSSTRMAIVDSDSDDNDEPKGSFHTDGKHTAVPFFSPKENESKRNGSSSNNMKKPPPSNEESASARRPHSAEHGNNDDDYMDPDAMLARKLQEEELMQAIDDRNAGVGGPVDLSGGAVYLPAGMSGGDYIAPSDDGDSDHGAGGGFLRSTDGDAEANGGGFLASSPASKAETTTKINSESDNNDAQKAQQLADEKLARALQNAEYEANNSDHTGGGGGFLPAGDNGPEYYYPSDDEKGPKYYYPSEDDNSDQGGGGFLPSNHNHEPGGDKGGGVLASSPAKAAKANNNNDDDDDIDKADAKQQLEKEMALGLQQLEDEKLAVLLQDAEYEGNKGGFVPTIETDDRKPAPKMQTGELFGLQGRRQLEAISADIKKVFGSSKRSESQWKGLDGPGFLTSSPVAKAAKAVNSDNDNDEAGRNAKMAQEIEDEKLARALQNEEYEDEVVVTGVKPAPASNLAADDRKPAANKQIGGGFLKPPPRSSQVPISTYPSKSPPIASTPGDAEEEDDDDIDWEDGGMENDEQEQQRTKQETHESDTTEPHPSSTDSVHQTKKPSRVPFGSRTASKSDSHGTRSTSKAESYSSVEKQPEKDVMVMDDFDELPTTSNNDWDLGASKSEKVSEALTHAQDTASRLTNWAGRAFRKAVAQHAQESGTEVPEASKPISLVPKQQKPTDEDASEHDEPSPVAQPYPPPQSPPKKRRTDQTSSASSPYFESSSSATTRTTTAMSSSQQHEQMERDMAAFASRETPANNDGMETVTDEMKAEVMQLLQLFGVPFVEAPAEAESQCVQLEQLGLVDGIVTEDSDAFVFGGQHIYKNIFDDKKYVELYNAQDAKKEMNLTKNGMVGLAMLLGGDYTQGVHGVGIVNGMEIIQAYNVSEDVHNLKRFRQWLDGLDLMDEALLAKQKNKAKDNDQEEGDDAPPLLLTKEEEFRKQHKTARTRWEAPTHFPDPRVLNAYLNPVVDTSDRPFSWGLPNVDGMVSFCTRNMGWTPSETMGLLKPVVQRLEESSSTMRQTRLDTFMRYEDGIKFADVRSKRLREVLETVQEGNKEKGATSTKAKATKKKQKTTK